MAPVTAAVAVADAARVDTTASGCVTVIAVVIAVALAAVAVAADAAKAASVVDTLMPVAARRR
jgi:hypothetical protein